MYSTHLKKNVTLEALNEENWLKICELSVSDEQKNYFSIPNIYWIGISRYEEHTELFAIKYKDEYVGLIGGGYDEDGVTGFINPFMIDVKYQQNGYAVPAMQKLITYMVDHLKVSKINISHRKVNEVASRIYENMGFKIVDENETEYNRSLVMVNIQ